METTMFTKGAVIRMPDNSTIVVIDSYAVDTKNIKVIAVVDDFNICILQYNLDTSEYSIRNCYDAVQLVAKLREL